LPRSDWQLSRDPSAVDWNTITAVVQSAVDILDFTRLIESAVADSDFKTALQFVQVARRAAICCNNGTVTHESAGEK
jgi:hypothetical protein